MSERRNRYLAIVMGELQKDGFDVTETATSYIAMKMTPDVAPSRATELSEPTTKSAKKVSVS